MAAKSFWMDGVSSTPPSFVLSANLVRVMLYLCILVINECINNTDSGVNHWGTPLETHLDFVPLITTLWAWLGSLIHPIICQPGRLSSSLTGKSIKCSF